MEPEIAKLKEIYDELVKVAPPPTAVQQAAWPFVLYLVAIMNAGVTTPAP